MIMICNTLTYICTCICVHTQSHASSMSSFRLITVWCVHNNVILWDYMYYMRVYTRKLRFHLLTNTNVFICLLQWKHHITSYELLRALWEYRVTDISQLLCFLQPLPAYLMKINKIYKQIIITFIVFCKA